jgi:uncharacterized protein YdhG (YjbR/CyaY superfamily)
VSFVIGGFVGEQDGGYVPKQKQRRAPSSRVKSDPQHPANVDDYLASVPADKRAALQQLRRVISAAAPRAEEGFSYGLPAFALDGRPLVCFGAATNHCSFYPMSPAVIRAHAAELKDYETSKGTIRFLAEKPLPAALVRKLVNARIAELAQARKQSRHGV